MERIVVEVNKVAAKKWRASTPKEKRKIAVALQQALQETGQVNEPPMGYARPSEEALQAHFNRVQKELPEYQKFLDEIGKKATERGLTEEILEQILKDA